jgi:hypothetical protein
MKISKQTRKAGNVSKISNELQRYTDAHRWWHDVLLYTWGVVITTLAFQAGRPRFNPCLDRYSRYWNNWGVRATFTLTSINGQIFVPSRIRPLNLMYLGSPINFPIPCWEIRSLMCKKLNKLNCKPPISKIQRFSTATWSQSPSPASPSRGVKATNWQCEHNPSVFSVWLEYEYVRMCPNTHKIFKHARRMPAYAPYATVFETYTTYA